MTAVDWGLLIIVGLSALLGMARGLIGVAVSLAAWLLAGLGAFLFGGDVGRSLTDGHLGWGAYLGGYALSFAVIWVGVGLIGMVIRRVAHSYGLSEMDRLMGLGLGAVRGVIFACMAMVFAAMTTLPRERAWRDSGLAAVLMPGAQLMRSALPDAMARKVDLEGRGTSLQATVQAEAQDLEKNLKSKVPGGALPGGFTDAMAGSLGGLGRGNAQGNAQGDPREPMGVLPEPVGEQQSGDLSGLTGLLPGAMRDLLPKTGQNRAEGNQIEGDPAQVDDRRRDDKQVH